VSVTGCKDTVAYDLLKKYNWDVIKKISIF